MSEKSEILDALIAFVKRNAGTKNGLLCTVTEINTTDNTCYCEPIGDYADIQQVRLVAKNNAAGNGFLVVPKLNSEVLVCFLDDESAYVSMFSDADKIYITIDSGNKLVFSSSGWVWNGGSFGGLIKINDLKTQWDSNVTAIKTAVAAALAVIDTQLVALSQPGGSVSTFNSSAAGIQAFDKTTAENIRVKH